MIELERTNSRSSESTLPNSGGVGYNNNNLTPVTTEVNDINLLERDEIKRVMDSDVAINALLTRLKESLLTCEEFTKYIRKKYILEEENMEELSKHYKHFFVATSSTSPSLRRTMLQILQFDGKIAQVKQSYVSALTKMYEELNALLLTMTKMRKSIKEKSRRLEKDVSDSIHSAEKAQARYNSLCQDWGKLKMTDPTKTKLTLRGSKTTKEQEEELQRKIDSADLDYKQRVDHSSSLRYVFLNTERPKIVAELRDLVLEIDTAMTIQLQKYTIWTENLVLNTGVTVSPLDSTKSMKSIVSKILNEKDLYNYLNKYNQHGKDTMSINKNLIPVPYKKHPSMVKGNLINPSPNSTFSINSKRNNLSNVSTNMISAPTESVYTPSSIAYPTTTESIPNANSTMNRMVEPTALASTIAAVGTVKSAMMAPNNLNSNTNPRNMGNEYTVADNITVSKPPTVNGNDSRSIGSSHNKRTRVPSLATTMSEATDNSGRPFSHIQLNSIMPPGTQKNFKTFCVPLESLLEFEQGMVPAIVRQCIYVIDTYGLKLEGIYRKSANVLDVSKLRDEIDKDPSNISMILPPKGYTESDIYVVSSLLKAFFAALPDPLVPSSIVPDLKICLSIDDPETMKNYMHGLIYKFPDAQYWTLRSLIFHLQRILANESSNRMNIKALSIIWGPTLIPPNDDDINDINFQIRAMDAIFNVADQAFESD